jgi:hypothetical protein
VIVNSNNIESKVVKIANVQNSAKDFFGLHAKPRFIQYYNNIVDDDGKNL